MGEVTEGGTRGWSLLGQSQHLYAGSLQTPEACFSLGNSARLAPSAPGQGQAQAQRSSWEGNRGQIMKDN